MTLKENQATVALYNILRIANKQAECSHPNKQKCFYVDKVWHTLCLTCGKVLD